MTSDHDLLSLLRCPFCTAQLAQSDGGLEYGVLACEGCRFEYPIVAGIPILMAAHETVDAKFETTELTLLDGPRVDHLVALVKSGDTRAALAALLNPSKLGGNWFPALALESVRDAELGESITFEGDGGGGGGQRLKRLVRRADRVARRRFGKFVLPRARARIADFLSDHAAELSALDVIDLYYRRYSGAETYNYFAYRFGQPRHLAALSLSLPLLEGEGPVLDLACGAGHVTHFLSAARPDRAVIGLDRDFFRLWLAAKYTAPSAHFVCAPADRRLPFADGAFGGTFCSDAFHCFLHRATTVGELARLTAQTGVIVLARFGNALVEPREGYELVPRGYSRLFGALPHVVLGEDELVESYRARRGPDLTQREIPAEVERQKWISIVASRDASRFRAGARFEQWPHALGSLQLNPIYRVENRSPNGDLELRFEFPSSWYEVENGGYLDYAPKNCRVSGEVMRAVAARATHPALDDLIAGFVLIGMPERYARP